MRSPPVSRLSDCPHLRAQLTARAMTGGCFHSHYRFRRVWSRSVHHDSEPWEGVAPAFDSSAKKYEPGEHEVAVAVGELPGVATLSPEELVEEAAHLHRIGKWQQAAEHYESAIELYYQKGPMAAECHNQRGTCLTEVADNARRKLADMATLQRAVDAHSKAIELEPTMFTAWHNRGNAYFRMNKLPEAIADFDRALAFDYSEETERLLTQARLEDGTPEAARALLAQALDAYQVGQFKAAKALFEDALDKGHPRIGRCYNGIAHCEAALNRHREAVEYYSVAIDHDGTDVSAWRNRAKSKAALGRTAESKAEEKMAATLLKKFPKGGHTGVTIATTVHALRTTNPNNICLSTFDRTYFNATLQTEVEKKDLLRCMRSGIENPDSNMGCYACQPEDYDRFKPFFS
eukprot:COSAG02_NODE_4317_length_5511_cov_264.675536_1_plen_404_part_10